MNRATKTEDRIILALDTALGACSVAIRRGDKLLASAFELRQTGHAEALMPMVLKVATEAGLTLGDIDVFATTIGPGTFTGLRIGLAAARGLAQSLDRPLAGFSTLEVIGWGALAPTPVSPLAENLVVVHDARRHEVYAQCFTVRQGGPGFNGLGLEAATAPCLLSLDDVAAYLPSGATWLAGSGAGLIVEMLPTYDATALSAAPINPDAAILAALTSLKLAGADLGTGYCGLPPIAPLYLRAPDAKLPGGASL